LKPGKYIFGGGNGNQRRGDTPGTRQPFKRPRGGMPRAYPYLLIPTGLFSRGGYSRGTVPTVGVGVYLTVTLNGRVGIGVAPNQGWFTAELASSNPLWKTALILSVQKLFFIFHGILLQIHSELCKRAFTCDTLCEPPPYDPRGASLNFTS